MHIQSLAYRTDLHLRRIAGADVTEHPDYLVVRTADNPHFWWGNFVLAAPDVLPRALEIFRSELPDASHIAIGVDGTGPELLGRVREAVASWGLAGSETGADTVLTAERLRAPGHPAGAEIRPLVSAGEWDGLVALRRVTSEVAPTAENDAFLVAKAAEDRRLCTSGLATWFGAFEGGQVVAALGIVPDGRGLARYQQVSTHPAHRRRGLASALLHAAAEHARAAGARTLVIVADPDAEAIGLYRRLGFTATEHQVRVQRPPA
ncbi:GNAT family N-acetyltransferase [Actinocorallia populi]|uniref:GNAT family N-acetyltransferase n=1 Tax=Actinocorallia populi TaxID=2079200 RepID=UPI000D094BA8|nr:GNAT family N-acetyltransferase [Actinocorallia populi]